MREQKRSGDATGDSNRTRGQHARATEIIQDILVITGDQVMNVLISCVRQVFLLLVLSVGLYSTTASGADKNAVCEEVLHTFYRGMPVLSEHSGWLLRYTVTMVQRDNNETKNVETELLMSANKMAMQSSEMEVYQDEKHLVTVVPGEKTIYLADRPSDQESKNTVQTLAMFRDTLLFSRCAIRECSDVRQSNGTTLKRIVLVLKPEAKATMQKRYPVESIELLIDTRTNTPYRYTTYFTDKYTLKSLAVTFHKVDFHTTLDKLSFRAGEKYLTTNQKLRPAYNSYTVIDVRKTR